MRAIEYAKKDMTNIKMTSAKMTPDDWVYVSSIYCKCDDCVKYGCADKPVIFVNPKVMHCKDEDSPEPANLGCVPAAAATAPPPPSVIKEVPLLPVVPVEETKKKEAVVIIRSRSLTSQYMGAIRRRKFISVSGSSLAALLNAK